MKTSKAFQLQYQMHGIDWQKFINNSIDQWRMQLEKVVEEGDGHIENLIWRHWLMILRDKMIVITKTSDMRF